MKTQEQIQKELFLVEEYLENAIKHNSSTIEELLCQKYILEWVLEQ